VGTKKIEETNRDQIVKMMVGKEIERRYLKEKIKKGTPLLTVRDLHTEKIRNVSFELRSGEILGVAGLLGSGRTELLETIYGCRKIVSGSIQLNGGKTSIQSPLDAIRAGITYLPEDREKKGLFLNLDVKENICAMSLSEDVKFGLIDKKKQQREIEKIIQQVRIVTPSISQTVNHLSGGNKQKVVLAKCIRSKPKVLLMGEPTRGIDVGAKVEIYGLMQEICKKGAGIIMVSSELPELLEISDKILVMHEGEMVALLDREKADKEKLMRAMTGYTEQKAGRG